MTEFHPLADIFPLMQGAEFDRLKADIETNGLREPISLLDGKILDGRNRARACAVLGVKPRSIELPRGEKALPYVLSMNLARRHMDESRRAMVAARLATLGQGARTDLSQICEMSQAGAAELLNVGKRSVEHARTVIESSDGDLIAAVDSGKLKVSVAAGLNEETQLFRASVLAKIDSGEKATEAIRQTRKEFLPCEVAKLPPSVYRVIYADPPWQYNDARRTGDHRQSTGAFDHYGDMSHEELCALDVKSIAATDSVLLMWGTFPLLPESLGVVEAWGFRYKTAFIWDKGHGSFGHYHDAEAEFMIIATRGSCTPDIDTKEKQIQRFARAEHSRKPEEWRALIDRLWPHGPRVELFRRGAAPDGWEVWGNEAEKAA